MIQIQAWQVNFNRSKLDLGLLIRTIKLQWILKLYTGTHHHTETFSSDLLESGQLAFDWKTFL